jgi:hypothetical protein
MDMVEPSELLDDRVCECCPTDAVATADGSIVVFRDRSEDETREIGSVSHTVNGFSTSTAVTNDGWRIPGCPVNGPAIDFASGKTAMAWFTGAESAPRVSAAFRSGTSGDFSAPVVVDGGKPLGRVGLVADGGGAVVSWLAIVEKEAELRLRRVAEDGSLGESFVVARTSAARASGMPQLERLGDDLMVAWVEIIDQGQPRIRVRVIPASMVPPTGV